MKKIQVCVIIVLIGILSLGMGISVLGTESKRTVRVGVFELPGFFEYTGEGKYSGYGIDYLNRVASYTGWEYQYIQADSWPDALKMLEDKKIDLLAPAEITSEREEKFGFSSMPIGMEYGAVLTLNTNKKLIYEDFDQFSKIKFGCVDTLIFKDDFLQYARNHGFTPQMSYYKDTPALMSALNIGEVDAVVANLMNAKMNMKVLGTFAPSHYYFMTQKEDISFIEELNSALNQIELNDSNFISDLTEKYFSIYRNSPFSKTELEYIEKAPVFNIGYISNHDPVSYLDTKTGEMMGITRDILDKVSEISGLEFNYIPLPQQSINYEFLKENKIHMVTSVEYNDVNRNIKEMHMTNPYLSSMKVVVARRGELFSRDKELRVALEEGSETLSNMVLEEYPNFEIQRYHSIEDCMEAVKKNKADILIQNQYVVEPYLSKPKFEELVGIPEEGLPDEMCMASLINQNNNPEMSAFLSDERLISIINKSIQQIDSTDIQKIIIAETTNRQYKFTIADFLYRYRYFLLLLILSFGIIGSLGMYALNIRRKDMKIIAENEWKLRNITNNINGGVIVLLPNQGFHIIYANEGFLNLIHWDRKEFEEVNTNDYITYIHPGDIEKLNSITEKVENGEKQVSLRIRIRRKDGTYLPTLFNGTLTMGVSGNLELYCVIMDISKEIEMLDKLNFEQKRYAILLEKSDDLIFDYDLLEGDFRISNKFEQRFGWSLPKRLWWQDAVNLWRVYPKDKELFQTMFENLQQGQESGECVVRIAKSDNSHLWTRISMYTMKKSDGSIYIVGKVADIDSETREKENLIEKAKTDTLTGLLNKEAFLLEAERYIKNDPAGNHAVVFVDLDNFKTINNLLGHLAGDEAIKEASKKLQLIFSHIDLISRFGGDEFCILVKDIPPETLRDKLGWAVEKLETVYENKQHTVKITSSIGVAYVNKDAATIKELLYRADKALYYAKENGKKRYVEYSDELVLNGYIGRSNSSRLWRDME